MDEYGQRLKDVVGPYNEGASLTLICEAEGGKNKVLCAIIELGPSKELCVSVFAARPAAPIHSLRFLHYDTMCSCIT